MLGFFDSGFGGLTILKEVIGAGARKANVKDVNAKKVDVKNEGAKSIGANYDFIYLGDTARAPYGVKSPEIIYEWTKQAVEYLFKQGCELVILACFSASAVALRRLQQEWLPAHYPDRRILGVLIPLAEQANTISRFGRIGILGTRATIKSGSLSKELKKHNADLEIFAQATPLLVPLIEEGWNNRPETKMILRRYLRPLKQNRVDTLLLACTHYPLLYKQIAGIMGKQVKIINPGKIVAASLADYLHRHPEIEKKLSKQNRRRFLTTDSAAEFEKMGGRFLGEDFKAEKVDLPGLI